MGSKDKFYGIQTADHGFDEIGTSAPAGTISAIADGGTASSRWSGKILLTVDTTANLKVGMAINITNLDAAHNGLTRILAVISATKIIVNITYDNTKVDGTGNWDCKGGASAWDAFIPRGADLNAANLTMTFWDSNQQGGFGATGVAYTKDVIYPVPGRIKTVLLGTAGSTATNNVELRRAATLRPKGAAAQ